ncbi:MAG: glucosamine-6-phosphate deaminase [Arcicella sp.]|nr:glucosamine-6-phosphate deaminase [Arcicella sp.]
MTIQKFPNYEELSAATAQLIIDVLIQKPEALICIASGDTPLGVCKFLAQSDASLFKKCTFVGLDEWVGMDENDEGSCKFGIYEYLLKPLNITTERIKYFDAKAADLGLECEKINQFIASRGGLDVMLVGVGMNGHIALNEPSTSFDTYAHVSDLEEITISVGQKYFKKPTILTQGITLGLKHLREAQLPILIANGARKAPIIKKALTEEITEQFPASIIQKIPHSLVMLEKEAAQEL